MRKLYIGNKNYSSWSMRPWVLLKQAGIPFEEVMVRFDSFEADSQFKTAIAALNPVGKVPVLVDGGPGGVGHAGHRRVPGRDLPEKQLWPRDRPTGRARAASAPRCTRASAPCATIAA
jgi:glutathione S-transferase